MILVIDNYDSFTYNLVQLIAGHESEARVVRNDEASVGDLLALRPAGIVLSPGPGRPESAGSCLALVASHPRIPLLGVCLGHQVLAQACGGEVDLAPVPVHGKTALIHHRGEGVFDGLDDPFVATRYHSLAVVEESLPEELEAVAWSEDGVLMGLRHTVLPYWGVQFHPESIMTELGPRLIGNFLGSCHQAPIGAER